MNAKKARVTIISLNYAPEQTGIAPYATDLANGLHQRGHAVQVIAGYPHYPSWEVSDGYPGKRMSETIDGVAVRRVRQYTPRHLTNAKRILLELSFGLGAVLQNWNKPDVVICTSPALLSTLLVSLRLRAFRRRPKLGIWVQDIYSKGLAEISDQPTKISGLAAKLESAVLRSADGVLVIHDRFRSTLTDGMSIEPRKIVTIRNWTHIVKNAETTAHNAREKHGWPERSTVILHAGNMGAKQGLENVINAAKAAHLSALPMYFVLLGDGNQREHLTKLAGNLPNLQFLDSLDDDDFQSALAASDMLLVNERAGVVDTAVPSKLTTYFLMERPIIAATDRRSATADEIRDSQAGIVVPPGDPEALIEAIQTLMGDSGLATSLARNGGDFYRANLDRNFAIDRFQLWLGHVSGKGDLK
ncbi:glycosyltransferase WbuB [Rhodococcus sp. 06-462-5]|uniref:glycosyltransferase family 4 protein n=1 Tax=unclassified Rhodococcus (in: high G+C Gram-positive bacteria) TaxID=192944 RepID=UPI000B9B76FF|nr:MULTISPECIES: glycosyltransferase family 4 protein [unclassified Rhodococcus (in: high G+C Gram-positive bacteria)]OZC75189.1 glycosyltransferase WbuB [Rhodococcus sp. 06-462-5]OZE67706.1 glycosyltransferase WbuB [Rhodococcus sp. 02-925g]